MKKVAKKILIYLSLAVAFLANGSIAYASGNVDQHFDKHYISNNEKAEISAAMIKSNVNEKISGLYSGEKNSSLTEPLKLYYLDDEDFINKYDNKNKLTKYLTGSYCIIQCIKSDSGKKIGAIIFDKVDDNSLKKINSLPDSDVKKEALKFYQANLDKWYVSSVGGYASPENLDFITDFNGIQEKLNNAGINKINDIYLLDSNGILPLMVYVQANGNEYALPIASNEGSDNFTTGEIYKLSDLVNSRIKVGKDIEKIPLKDRQLGGSNTNQPQLKPIDKVNQNSPILLFVAVPVISLLMLLAFLKYRNSLFKALKK